VPRGRFSAANKDAAMTITTHPPETEKTEPVLDRGSGGGGLLHLGPVGETRKAVDDPSPEPVRTGIWIGLAAITMSFAAFTSALVVRQSTANDWHHLVLPPIVFVNTLILVASSATLEAARRRVATFFRSKDRSRTAPRFWLWVTLLLGIVFVAGQYVAWLKLRAQGLYLATNPNSAFFYVLTAMHALHVLGGLAGLGRVLHKLRAPVALRRSTLDATSYYWHFMGILWLYLLFVVWLKL
jgi:cytochrome c oxidase subunit III